ncbi:MAG: hydroxymethylpyrimidine pyrophosphatase-like HAD family hydrolase [Rhodothermales bacterium]|jgi:hydroxymethylpyrimidine pyrophosphatase-like HAD family hydrolase
MIRLFVSDVDGCLAEPYVPFNLEHFRVLRALVGEGSLSGVPEMPPAFTLCTGRPLGYAEAVAQALGITEPFLFEAGAGMYYPTTGVRRWHPGFGTGAAEEVEDIQNWLEGLVQGTSLAVDRGKHTQAGVIGANEHEIQQAMEATARFIGHNHPRFVVAYTPISVDVMLGTLTKAQGLAWLAAELGISVAEMAFIGDTNGDLGAIKTVGSGFAPANGTPEVRQAAGTVTRGRVSAGVLEAVQACIERNRASPN